MDEPLTRLVNALEYAAESDSYTWQHVASLLKRAASEITRLGTVERDYLAMCEVLRRFDADRKRASNG